MHAFDDQSREVGVQRLETRGNPLLRALGHVRVDVWRLYCEPIPPGQELRIPRERIQVYLSHAFAEQIAAALGAPDVTASRRFNKAGLQQITTRPIEPVGEDRLLPARHKPPQLFARHAQGLGELFLDARDVYLVEPLTSQ